MSEIQKAIDALHSDLRRKILQLLAEVPLNLNRIYNTLKQDNTKISRVSVYKHVEKMVKSGLVAKFYDSERKSIMYKLVYSRILFDISTGDVTFYEHG